MDIEQYTKSIVERLQASASVKTTYGDPVTIEGKAVIPVARVRYGFGAGRGPASGRNGETKTEGGEGAGGAGCVVDEPLDDEAENHRSQD